MFQELFDILSDRVSPELMSGVSAVVSALDKHQATLYKDQIAFLLHDANNVDPQVLSDKAISIIYNQVYALLQQLKIKLTVDVMRLELLAELLEGLLFKPSDFDQEILSCIHAGEDSTETFINILCIVLNKQPEDIFEFIEFVDPEVVPTIETVVQAHVDNYSAAMTGLAPVVNLLSKHQTLVGEHQTIGTEIIQSGSLIEDPMSIIEGKGKELSKLNETQLADELISVGIHVTDSLESLQDEVMFYAENILDDVVSVQRTYRHVKSRIKQLSE